VLSIVILSYNRRDALRRTLKELCAQGLNGPKAQVIVVDNASSDGSGLMVRDEFPEVELVELRDNIGIAGFNRGAGRATGDMLLLLDDDAWPQASGLDAAVQLLQAHAEIGAVSLLPKHPTTGAPEFRHGARARGRWPFMGCGNLVRLDAWRKVGGYEERFFLYRNDTDLGLKLLGAGYDVWFNPEWVVWHDSPAAAEKSRRWLHLATRNWGWMARRHGRRLSRMLGMAAGFAWASRLAGISPARQWAVMRGVWEGTFQPAPPVPAACVVDGAAFRELLKVQIAGRR
jgi:GT2 family glycosyltransferase